MNSKRTFLSLAVSALFLSACGGGGGSSGGNDGGTGVAPNVTPAPTSAPLPSVSAAAPVSNNGGANFEFALVTGFNGDLENSGGAVIAGQTAPVSERNITVVKAEIGQVNLKEPGSDYFALVAGRDALLRVVTIANQANVVAPRMKVTVSKVSGGTVFEQVLENNTKGLLPQVADQPTVLLKGMLGKDEFTAAIDYPTSEKVVKTTMPMPDMNRSYVIKLPASILTAEALKVEVALLDVSDAIATDNAKIYTIEPMAMDALTVVKVPVTVNGFAPTLPSDDTLKRAIMSVIPVPNVIVKTRSSAVVTSQGDTVSAPGSIASIKDKTLTVLTSTRNNDITSKIAVESDFYMGFLAAGNIGGVTTWGGFASIVQDSLKDSYIAKYTKATWQQELLNSWGSVGDSGSCGARLDDVNYPYYNAGLNGIWNIDLFSVDNKVILANPHAFTNVTSYCANSFYMADNQVKRMIRDYWPMRDLAYMDRAITMNKNELQNLGTAAYNIKYPNGFDDMPDMKFIMARQKNSTLPVPKQGW
ncbi:hypothetical protein [Deefgea sp. CFH1-16]|uniref:hypothetical protein n=1 Tax=Deefgea sp. CFH1-16 TaxID=2675457 RepID=UPI0015F4A483|nr:hypothetical protein [Deefgea sp. CFH1-16]MBM5575723.1 hypothetical protein [Deefgea sp. CFH1-16]